MARKRSRRVRPAEELVVATAPAADDTPAAVSAQPMFELVESARTPKTRLEELESEPDDERAIEAYRQLVLNDPANVLLRLHLGSRYEKRGEYALALEQYEAARAESHDSVDVLVKIGGVLGMMGRFDRSEKELRRAVKLAPDRADAAEALGILQFKRGSYSQAELDLRHALALEPDRPLSLFHRGEALNHLGRIDEALDMLERAVLVNPRNAKAFFTMGILYDRKHLRDEAQAMYRKAREVSDS